MTKQKIFDQVWQHFIVGRAAPSYDERFQGADGCRYRGPDGTRCAIGLLIPDDRYTPDMEGKSITQAMDFYTEICELFVGIEAKFLDTLQRCHDFAAQKSGQDLTLDERYQICHRPFHDQLEFRLRRLAGEWKLEVPV